MLKSHRAFPACETAPQFLVDSIATSCVHVGDTISEDRVKDLSLEDHGGCMMVNNPNKAATSMLSYYYLDHVVPQLVRCSQAATRFRNRVYK